MQACLGCIEVFTHEAFLSVQEVAENFERVLEIVNSQVALLSASSPPALRLKVSCPKVTVSLSSSVSSSSTPRAGSMLSAGSSVGSQGSQVIAELSLHELQLAGERLNAACHGTSPAGPSPKKCMQTLVNASIARLHICSRICLSPQQSLRVGAPSCIATSPAVSGATMQQQVDFDVFNGSAPHDSLA